MPFYTTSRQQGMLGIFANLNAFGGNKFYFQSIFTCWSTINAAWLTFRLDSLGIDGRYVTPCWIVCSKVFKAIHL
ncbi:MAG: hypothetical protein CME95_09775 [Hyphomonadaceae bacterium]|nr:hypothetical protein [Hyphomonadaceae bacterium]